MSIASWPSGVSFIAKPDTFRESGPTGNVIRTPMENGPSKSRRRFTAAPRLMSGQTDIITNAQIDTFETWFEDVIASGALPFTATNPRTNAVETYKFMETYELIHINDDKNRIGMKLERLP